MHLLVLESIGKFDKISRALSIACQCFACFCHVDHPSGSEGGFVPFGEDGQASQSSTFPANGKTPVGQTLAKAGEGGGEGGWKAGGEAGGEGGSESMGSTSPPLDAYVAAHRRLRTTTSVRKLRAWEIIGKLLSLKVVPS